MKMMYLLFLLGLWACGGKTHTNSPVPLIIVDSNFLEKQAKAMDTAVLVHTKKETPRDCSDSSLYKSVMGEMIMSLMAVQDSLFGLKMGDPLLDSLVIANSQNYLKELLLCGKVCYPTTQLHWLAEVDTFDDNGDKWWLRIERLNAYEDDCTYDCCTSGETHFLLLPTLKKDEWVVAFQTLFGGLDPADNENYITAWKWNRKTKKWRHFHQCLPKKLPKKLFFGSEQSKELYRGLDIDRCKGIKDGIHKKYYYFTLWGKYLTVSINTWGENERDHLPFGECYKLYFDWDKQKECFVYVKRELDLLQ